MKIKRFVAPILLIALFLTASLLLSSCKADYSTGYVSDEEREAHILYLLGGSMDNIAVAAEYPAASLDFEETATVTNLGLKDFVKVKENKNFVLYLDFNDASFAVYDKNTEMIYHSDPTNSKADSKADDGRSKLESPIAVEAYDSLNKRFEFNFYDDCWEDNNYQITWKDADTLRIIFTVGNDPDKDLVPPVLTMDTYNWIVSQIEKLPDAKQQKDCKQCLKDCYKHITPDTLDLDTKEQYQEYYPTIDYMELQVVRALNTKQKSVVKQTMETVGFTAEMLKKEMEKAEYSGPERAVMYTIPVDIKLAEDGLYLNVDTAEILAPSKQKLYKIYFYRSFGALNGKTVNNQYMIIPDGSGAIMPITGNLTTDVFTARIYGNDQTFNQDQLDTVNKTVLSGFGFYDRGVKTSETDTSRNYGSIFMTLEDGTAQAFISARPFNSTNNIVASLNYDLVYSERDYRTYSGGQSSSGGSTEISSHTDSSGNGVVLAKDETIANFVIHYQFLEGGKTYSEYAKIFRDYLIKRGMLSEKTISNAGLQFYIEMLASFEKSESVAGIPVTRKTALTTYKQAQELLEKLKADGVSDVQLRYMYWCNNGYFNTLFNNVKLLNCLGSQSQLKSLTQTASANGYGFYPNAEFMYIYRDKVGDGLNYTQDAARRLDMRLARLNERNLATGSMMRNTDTQQTILSPDLIPGLAASFEESYAKTVGNNQISLGNIGEYLNSNYKNKRNINRTKAIEYQNQALDTYKDYDLMINTGNDYTWAYANHIVNFPIGSSEYLSTTESIPFLQMALHGRIYYADSAFNLSADYATQLLNCLETGSNIFFNWMAADDTIFYNTDFNDWYSLNYENTYDRALAMYKELKPMVDKVASLEITEHHAVKDAILPGGTYRVLVEGDEGYNAKKPEANIVDDTRVSVNNVFKTVYGDKYYVFVNYNSFEVEVQDETAGKIVIAPMGYSFGENK